MRYLARNLTRVNVNTASAREIAPVLDIGEKLAQAVIQYRSENGHFTSVDDLKKVPGLDAAKLQHRKEKIAFK